MLSLFLSPPLVLSLFLQGKANGQTLLDDVYRRINLIESDYFGLEFQNVQMNWVGGGMLNNAPVCMLTENESPKPSWLQFYNTVCSALGLQGFGGLFVIAVNLSGSE